MGLVNQILIQNHNKFRQLSKRYQAISIIIAVGILIFSFLPSIGYFSDGNESIQPDNEFVPESDIKNNLTSMKGWFTENNGQNNDTGVKYIYAASDRSVGFVESGYIIKMTNADNLTSLVKVSFEGANPVSPEGSGKLTHMSNYFIGRNSSNWRTGVSNYQKVVYSNLYDGIDMIFYTVKEGLKFDFILSTGSDPEKISIHYGGVSGINVDSDGNLIVTTSSGSWLEEKPYCYQLIDSKLVEVSSDYLLDNHIIKYTVKSYNRNHTLIIDPLIYSTYFGGSAYDESTSVCIDSENNAYVTGGTSSSNFPITSGGYDETHNGDRDVFVFKMSHDGSNLIYSTFIGGSSVDVGLSLTIDSYGNTYITGMTTSIDFPTTVGSFDQTYNGGGLIYYGDSFVFKLNIDGSNLVYSTYLGGILGDSGQCILVDLNDCAYITGFTESPDFPTTLGSYDIIHNGGFDAFIAKVNPDGSELVYSTFVGGSSSDYGYSIVADENNNIYATGSTGSSDFPTTSESFDETHNGEEDVILFRLSQDGSELDFSTFIGGSGRDRGWDLCIDSKRNLYVTGYTESPNFPTTPGCYDDTYEGDSWDTVILKCNNDGSDMIFSTFVGGVESDEGYSVVIDTENYVYVSGATGSFDFPVTSGSFDVTFNYGTVDTFILKMNPRGSELTYSTYMGGTEVDRGLSIAIDSLKNVYVTGLTHSMDFPTTSGSFDESYNGNREIFLLKLEMTPEDANNFGDGRDDDEFLPHLPAGIIVAVGLFGLVGIGYVREDFRFVLYSILTIPLYSKLEKDEIINQPNRRLIYQYLVENPGINLTKVCQLRFLP